MIDRTKPNVLLGLAAGLFMAVWLSLIATAIYVVRPGTFDRLGISLGTTLSIYLFGGLIGGVLFGVLFPVTQHRWGAAVVGIIVAVPAYLGAAMFLGTGIASGIIPAVLVGGAVGWLLWEPPAGSHHRKTQNI